MLQFAHQEYLSYLLLLLLPSIAYFYYKKKWVKTNAQLQKNANANLLQGYSPIRKNILFATRIACLILIIISLAHLQKPDATTTNQQQNGIEIAIALDVSNSMYAQDVIPNRLEKAKLLIGKIAQQLNGNNFALILFAGRPYISLPLTTDVSALVMNLSIAKPELIPSQGTRIHDALEACYRTLENKNTRNKAIVLISDGEDHEEGAVQMAKELYNKKISVYTVGVGTENGSNITMPGTQEPKTDGQGNIVLSKMNPDALGKIATAGGGKYYTLDNINDVFGQLNSELSQMEKGYLGKSKFLNYKSYYQYFLFLALAMLLATFFISESNMHKSKWAFVLFLFLNSSFLQAQTVNSNIHSGNQLYKNKNYNKANTAYSKELKNTNPQTRQIAQYNLANSLLKNKNYEQALKLYNQIGLNSKDAQLRAKAYHNAGNASAEQEDWQSAVNYYKSSLKNNPSNEQTKYNLAFAQKKLQQNKEKQPQPKPKEDKPKEDKPNNPEPKDEQPKPSNKMSKEQANRLLDALNREEQKLKEAKEKEKGQASDTDKDW